MATTPAPKRLTASEVLPWVVLIGGGLFVYNLLHEVTEDFWRPCASGSVPMPKGQRPTLDDSALSMLAERIYAAAWEGWVFWEDEDDMTRALWELNNNADVARLFNIYGIRRGPFVLDAAGNLVQMVSALFDDDQVATLNAGLSAKGITYLF